MKAVAVALILCLITLSHCDDKDNELLDIEMPNVHPERGETYLCRSLEMDRNKEMYLVKFVPKADMRKVHHLILYGCSSPSHVGEVWNCGGMHTAVTRISKQYPQSGICSGGEITVLYAWAMDAVALELPDGVGFHVGGSTKIRYLVLQVHYLMPSTEPDHSGVTVHVTSEQLQKTAGVVFMMTLGRIRANSTEKFESTCVISDPVELHPFAYRVHTHGLGRVVSGYVVQQKDWHLLGKINPHRPQTFYPVNNDSLIIRQGDILASRCTMQNQLDETVYIGATSNDEMCNFYLMYWVEGNATLTRETCNTLGPPYYYWSKDIHLEGTKIPDIEASALI